jgi:hypothetical protein
MAIVVSIDYNKVSINVMEMVMTGFSLLQLTSFKHREYDVVKSLDGMPEKDFLVKDHPINKMTLEERSLLVKDIHDVLGVLESSGHIKKTFSNK